MKELDGNGGSQSGAIGKTLAVLGALPLNHRLSAIAETTGLPKSTVHRILKSLVEHGFARSGGDGQYLPGPQILSIAGQVLSTFDYALQLGPALRNLQDRTGFTIHFAVLAGAEAVYVEKLENTDEPYRMASRVGTRLRLHCTAIGKAILAGLPADEADQLLAQAGMEARTANTITTLPQMHRELERVRERGYAIDDEENEASTRCVGAAVLDHRGRVIGAISVSTLTFLLTPEEAEQLGPVVVDTALTLSATLGATV